MKHNEPFDGLFHGTKVLVTGHTGFKGGWLALWLERLGAEVAGYSLEPPTQPNLFETVELEKRIDHTLGDVRDFDRLESVVRRVEPRVIFHLAAQAIVRQSYRVPRETFETNVQGTVNLLEAARLAKSVESLVVVTSDKCYEERPSPDGYCETDRLGGRDPYSASKGMAELAAAAYLQSFFSEENLPDSTPRLGLASARAGNVIGGGDFGEDRLVPDCVRSLMAGRSIDVRMPQALRPWQFVLEPLSGYLLLAARLLQDRARFAGPYNFGPLEEKGRAVRELVDRVIALWGEGSWNEGGSTKDPAEASELRLNWNKAAQVLGWNPLYTLDQAIEETVAWYKAFHSGTGAAALSDLALKQIRAYESHARAHPQIEYFRDVT